MSLDHLKKVVLKDGKETCFYRIKEQTKGEYVTVGDDGNILRWEGKDIPEQKWLILPINAEGDCQIITLQNGECMSVSPNGNILRWANNKGIDQQFKFVNKKEVIKNNVKVVSYNIQEKTKSEYVSVGSNGNIVRWAGTQKDEQRFILEPIQVVEVPKVDSKKFSNEVYDPNNIISYPSISTIEQGPAEQSAKCFIGFEILPSVFVDDPNYSSKIQQVEDYPYYYLVRRRFWSRAYNKVLVPGVKETEEAVIHIGMSVTDTKEIETTIGVAVSASVKGELGTGKAPDGANFGSQGKLTGELAAEFSWERRELESHEEKKERSLEKKVSITINQKHNSRVVAWQITDEYSLYGDLNEEPIRKWTVRGEQVDWVEFPKS